MNRRVAAVKGGPVGGVQERVLVLKGKAPRKKRLLVAVLASERARPPGLVLVLERGKLSLWVH